MNRFSQRLGGLPVWVWSAILGGALILMVAWSRHRAGAVPAKGTTSPTGAQVPLGGGALPEPSTRGGGGAGAYGGGAGAVTGASDYTSNQTWLAQGLTLLGGQGVAPLQAESALTRYLNGGGLTAGEQDWINRVISAKGLAPQGTAGLFESIGADGLTASQRADAAAANAAAQTATFSNYGAAGNNPDALAKYQADWDALNGQNSLQAVNYSSNPGARTQDTRDYYLNRYLSTHGGYDRGVPIPTGG